MAKGLDWVFPVIGTNEWTHGSWMPNTLTHRGRTHAAIDIYAPRGAQIVAPVGGRVEAASTGKIGGNYVRIIGDDGIIYYFAHLDSKSHLRAGDRIEKAQLVGYVGNTGSAKSVKTHLHFSMRQVGSNNPINPISYLEGAYKLDAPPGQSILNMGTGEEIYQQPYSPNFTYASAADVAAAVMGGDEVAPAPTAREALASVMGYISNQIAGGKRTDYRTLGIAGVPRSELEVRIKQAGEVPGVNEPAEVPSGDTITTPGQ